MTYEEATRIEDLAYECEQAAALLNSMMHDDGMTELHTTAIFGVVNMIRRTQRALEEAAQPGLTSSESVTDISRTKKAVAR